MLAIIFLYKCIIFIISVFIKLINTIFISTILITYMVIDNILILRLGVRIKLVRHAPSKWRFLFVNHLREALQNTQQFQQSFLRCKCNFRHGYMRRFQCLILHFVFQLETRRFLRNLQLAFHSNPRLFSMVNRLQVRNIEFERIGLRAWDCLRRRKRWFEVQLVIKNIN